MNSEPKWEVIEETPLGHEWVVAEFRWWMVAFLYCFLPHHCDPPWTGVRRVRRKTITPAGHDRKADA